MTTEQLTEKIRGKVESLELHFDAAPREWYGAQIEALKWVLETISGPPKPSYPMDERGLPLFPEIEVKIARLALRDLNRARRRLGVLYSKNGAGDMLSDTECREIEFLEREERLLMAKVPLKDLTGGEYDEC